MKKIEMVIKYVNLVQNLDFSPSTTKDILHENYLQWELPNLLNKHGQKSDLEDSFRRMEMAKKIMAKQTYEITSTLEQNNQVMIETLWTGTMAIEAGPFKKDQQLKAFICMIFEFKDGKIFKVRNYDCFEPFN